MTNTNRNRGSQFKLLQHKAHKANIFARFDWCVDVSRITGSKFFKDYVIKAEHLDGIEYWQHFKTVSQLVEDVDMAAAVLLRQHLVPDSWIKTATQTQKVHLAMYICRTGWIFNNEPELYTVVARLAH